MDQKRIKKTKNGQKMDRKWTENGPKINQIGQILENGQENLKKWPYVNITETGPKIDLTFTRI